MAEYVKRGSDVEAIQWDGQQSTIAALESLNVPNVKFITSPKVSDVLIIYYESLNDGISNASAQPVQINQWVIFNPADGSATRRSEKEFIEGFETKK